MEERIYNLLKTLHQWGISNTDYGFCRNARVSMFCNVIDGLREQPCLYIRRTTGNDERIDRIPVDWDSSDQICVVDEHVKYYLWYFTINKHQK